MRRLLALLLTVVAFVACGGDDDDDDGAAPTETTSVAETTGVAETTTASDAAQWSYTDLNGQLVIVIESDGTSFTGGVPEPVAVIDSVAADCAAVQVELDHWLSQLDDPDIGPRASAYAQYALDQAATNACTTLNE